MFVRRLSVLALFTLTCCGADDGNAPASDPPSSSSPGAPTSVVAPPASHRSSLTRGGQASSGAHLPLLQVHLRTWNNRYVAAERGGGDVVVADRQSPGPWETFTLWDANGGELESGDTIFLMTHDDTHYVGERADGSMAAQALSSSASEAFVVTRLAGPGIIRSGDAVWLRSTKNKYVVAEGGGGGAVNANRDHGGPWETFRLDFLGSIAHPSALVGPLRIENGAFVDATGPVLPLFCHFGEAFSRYTRNRAAVLAQLDEIAKAGYHGIRFWTTLGGPYWSGREVGESVTPGYWTQLGDFLRDLQARQLRAVISQGDIGRIVNRASFAENLANVLDAVGPSVAAIVEAGNETWQTGEPDPQQLAQFLAPIRQRHPVTLLTLSSPPGETKQELDAWSVAPADLFDVHGYRGGHWWDKVRHIFSITYEGQPVRRLGWQGEPAGPGAAVSVTENKPELDDDTLAAMGAMSLMARQAWCYMSGPGVLFDSPLHAQPGFRSVPKAVAALPRDIMSFQKLVHGGIAWQNERVFAAEGETRVDQALSADGRFVAIAYGPTLTYSLARPATIESVTDLGGKARIIVGRR